VCFARTFSFFEAAWPTHTTHVDDQMAPPRSTTTPLRLDAAPLLGAPVTVHTTEEEMRGLERRMRAEPRARLVALSNAKYRSLADARARIADFAPETEEWQRVCGDVVVFTCARRVLEAGA
jgi:hypothetical protein